MNKAVCFLTATVIAFGLWGCGKGGDVPSVKNGVFTDEFREQAVSVKYTRSHDYSYESAKWEWETEETVMDDEQEVDEIFSVLRNLVLEQQEEGGVSIGGGTPSDSISLDFSMKDGTYVEVVFAYEYYYITVYEFETADPDERFYGDGICYYVENFNDAYWQIQELGEGARD